jgi:hypothetical protein
MAPLFFAARQPGSPAARQPGSAQSAKEIRTLISESVAGIQGSSALLGMQRQPHCINRRSN